LAWYRAVRRINGLRMAKRWNAGLASIRLRAFSQRNFHA
jgi:hypothetical protein